MVKKKRLKEVQSIICIINKEISDVDVKINKIKKLKDVNKKMKLLQIVKQKKNILKKSLGVFFKTMNSLKKDYAKVKHLNNRFNSVLKK